VQRTRHTARNPLPAPMAARRILRPRPRCEKRPDATGRSSCCRSGCEAHKLYHHRVHAGKDSAREGSLNKDFEARGLMVLDKDLRLVQDAPLTGKVVRACSEKDMAWCKQ
jgi:hypothetical protein